MNDSEKIKAIILQDKERKEKIIFHKSAICQGCKKGDENELNLTLGYHQKCSPDDDLIRPCPQCNTYRPGTKINPINLKHFDCYLPFKCTGQQSVIESLGF